MLLYIHHMEEVKFYKKMNDKMVFSFVTKQSNSMLLYEGICEALHVENSGAEDCYQIF